MKTRRFFWKLVVAHSLLMAAALTTCVAVMLHAISGFQSEELDRQLHAHAVTLRQVTQDRFDAAHGAELEQFVKSLAVPDVGSLRITLIDASGRVLADTDANAAGMPSHADRPEVIAAMRNGWGRSERHSATVNRDMVYIALRAGDATSPRGVVRVSMPKWRLGANTLSTRRLVWTIAAAALGMVVCGALAIGAFWSRPINKVLSAARSFSRGDLNVPLAVTGSDEIALLARSLNRMRDRLSVQVETIDRHRRTLEAMIAQLHEAVIVVGPDQRIVLLNPSAAHVLQIAPLAGALGTSEAPAGAGGGAAACVGKTIDECIPHDDLRRLLQKPTRKLNSMPDPSAIAEERITIELGNDSKSLLARASDIVLPGQSTNDNPAATGRLLVLTDVTEMVRTIQIKTDFVANASHELRTPLSAIRAAVETLQAMDLAAEADAVDGFFSMIERHVRRLEAMVTDLLSLSRLESPSTQFERSEINLPGRLTDLRDRFAEGIDSKQLVWTVDYRVDNETVRVSPQLLGLVLDNLVENAIKFTEPGGSVTVSCRGHDDGIDVCVRDTGCGIPEDEQARVFERFYQVERARSGPQRGTGLGLSIVRHAVSAMGGAVRLDSKPGEGTAVTFTIPT